MKRCIICGHQGDGSSTVCEICGNPYIDISDPETEAEENSGDTVELPDELGKIAENETEFSLYDSGVTETFGEEQEADRVPDDFSQELEEEQENDTEQADQREEEPVREEMSRSEEAFSQEKAQDEKPETQKRVPEPESDPQEEAAARLQNERQAVRRAPQAAESTVRPQSQPQEQAERRAPQAAESAVRPQGQPQEQAVRRAPQAAENVVRPQEQAVRRASQAAESTVRPQSQPQEQAVRRMPQAAESTVRPQSQPQEQAVRRAPQAAESTVRPQGQPQEQAVRRAPQAAESTVRPQSQPQEQAVRRTTYPQGQPMRRAPQTQSQPQGRMPYPQGQAQGRMPYPQGQPQGRAPYPQGQPQGRAPYPQGQPQGRAPYPQGQPQGRAPYPQGQPQGRAPYPQGQPQGRAPYPQGQPPRRAPRMQDEAASRQGMYGQRLMMESKKAFHSPMFLVMTILFTLFLGASVASAFLQHISFTQILQMFMNLGISNGIMMYAERAVNILASLENDAEIIILISQIPNAMLCIGFWIMYLTSGAKQKMSGAGFLLAKIVVILELIVACVIFLGCLLLGVVLVVSSWVTRVRSTQIASVAFLVAVIVITMMGIMFFFCYLRTLKVCRLNATRGEEAGKVSAYAAVLTILMVVFAALSLLVTVVNMEIAGIVRSICSAGWMTLLGVWTLGYRSKVNRE